MDDMVKRADALSAIEALKYGDIAHDAETESHDDAMHKALAAINALPGVGWQPIETAPKDGTWVLLTGGLIDYGWDRDTQPLVVAGQFVGTVWQFAWCDGGYYGEYENPTHWMPLPDAPSEEK